MIKEKVYKYKNYQISYDDGLKDRSFLVIGIKEKDTLYITDELYDESANAVIKILDNLQNQLQQKETIIKEVREYIECHTPSDIGICGNGTKKYYTLGEDSVDHILEILDKALGSDSNESKRDV